MSVINVLDELKYIYKVDTCENKKEMDKVVTLSNLQKEILKALSVVYKIGGNFR